MASKPTILITGANGQMGKELSNLSSSYPSFTFISLSKEELPVQDESLVNAAFEKYKPQYLINAAAYTAVDKAESDEENAYDINAKAVGILATACRKYATKFVHLSTDYVFDGTASTAYVEDAVTGPQSVYGASKLEGEKLLLEADPSSIIIRTSWLYSEFGKNFVKTMLRLMSEKVEINVVNNQVGSPTYAADLAEAILDIITSGNWQPGIYHYCNAGTTSWFDFAVAIKTIINSPCILHPIPSSQYPTPAIRPAYSVLDTKKIRHTYGLEIRGWKESLRVCLSRI